MTVGVQKSASRLSNYSPWTLPRQSTRDLLQRREAEEANVHCWGCTIICLFFLPGFLGALVPTPVPSCRLAAIAKSTSQIASVKSRPLKKCLSRLLVERVSWKQEMAFLRQTTKEKKKKQGGRGCIMKSDVISRFINVNQIFSPRRTNYFLSPRLIFLHPQNQ